MTQRQVDPLIPVLMTVNAITQGLEPMLGVPLGRLPLVGSPCNGVVSIKGDAVGVAAEIAYVISNEICVSQGLAEILSLKVGDEIAVYLA